MSYNLTNYILIFQELLVLMLPLFRSSFLENMFLVSLVALIVSMYLLIFIDNDCFHHEHPYYITTIDVMFVAYLEFVHPKNAQREIILSLFCFLIFFVIVEFLYYDFRYAWRDGCQKT